MESVFGSAATAFDVESIRQKALLGARAEEFDVQHVERTKSS